MTWKSLTPEVVVITGSGGEKMPVIDRRGQPLPDNHPFKRGFIGLGIKPPAGYLKKLEESRKLQPHGWASSESENMTSENSKGTSKSAQDVI